MVHSIHAPSISEGRREIETYGRFDTLFLQPPDSLQNIGLPTPKKPTSPKPRKNKYLSKLVLPPFPSNQFLLLLLMKSIVFPRLPPRKGLLIVVRIFSIVAV